MHVSEPLTPASVFMRPIVVVSLIVFLQTLCVGANFSTLKFYSHALGGEGLLVGLLWFALTAPRALLSPFWGSLSDRWGRRPLMILGSLGAIGGSALWATASSYNGLLASRLVDSLLSAQATLAFAIIADCTTKERRAAGMGIVGAAVMMGFTFGPVMGGLIAEHAGFATLGWVMAALQGAGLLLVVVALPETRSREHAPGAELARAGLRGLAAPLHRPKVGLLLLVSLVMTIGYTHFNTAFPDAMHAWHGWTQHEMSIPFALLGIVGGLVQGGLLRPLVPRWGERRVILVGIALMAAGFVLMMTWKAMPFLLAMTALVAAGGGLAIPTIAGLLSRQLQANEQGLVLGLNQTAQGVGRGVGPLVASFFPDERVRLAFASAAVVLIVAWMVMARVRQPRGQEP